MSDAYTCIPSLGALVEVPDGGVLSKPVFTNEHLRCTLFGLAPGEELSEHTTTMEAVVQILEGEAEMTLGGDAHTVQAGAWIRMEPNLPHSIKAVTPVKFLLAVLREVKA